MGHLLARRTATLALLAVLGLTACSGMPTHSAPQTEGSSDPGTAETVATSAPEGGEASGTPATREDGKQVTTGIVVTTTYAQRAAEVGLTGDDYANDQGLLTLLMLDSPIQVTAYRGGSDYTGVASVICLPNDELFRQFSGTQIGIAVDRWGEWPADLSGKLYDLVLDFDADGLELAEDKA